MRAALVSLFFLAGTAAQGEPDYSDVAAIFQSRCTTCHFGPYAPVGLSLASYDDIMSGSWNGQVASPGNPGGELLARLRGEALPRMPLDGPPFLDDTEIDLIEAWIVSGMPDSLQDVPEVQARPIPQPGEDVIWPDVQPILRRSCIECHSDNSKYASPPEGLRLDSLENVLDGGERLAVMPGQVRASELWRRVTGHASPRMPYDGPPWLSEEEIRLISDWIAQGARDENGQPAPIPEGKRVRWRGILTSENSIDGAEFRITPSTRIDDRPRIGAQAEMRGMVAADGSILATRLRDR